jgi:formylglycine-generating enzyme required for sulfatase activity
MTAKVFISYRRDDSAGHAGRVHDRLAQEFGHDLLFMDVDSIPLGADFIKVLRGEVARCDVLLAVIGSHWLDARDEQGNRRLDSENDFVRIEIATALQRDIPVIPILLDGVKLPKSEQLPKDLQALTARNGLDIRHASFHIDMDKLIGGLKGQPDHAALPRSASALPSKKKSAASAIVITGVLAAVLGGTAVFWFKKTPHATVVPPSPVPTQPATAANQPPAAPAPPSTALSQPAPAPSQSPAAPAQPAPAPSQQAAAPVQPLPTPAIPAPVNNVELLTPIREHALQPKESFKECTNCPVMTVVPAGSFVMGSPETELGRKDTESPQHKVTFAKKFAVGRFSVTFDEWDACVADGGCNGYSPPDQGWGRGTRPVINVSWNEAQTYLAWLSRKTGKTYRLPSEAEREYVTRAATTTPFWWGSSISTTQANYNGNYTYGDDGARGEFRNESEPVDTFAPNPWGLYQVHGNVSEWTQDCWHDNYTDAPTDGTAWLSPDCKLRVRRGGSIGSPPFILRSAFRLSNPAANRQPFLGFRVARPLSP